MEIQEAIKVIRALADGVNPETRELLKDDSICRNPQAVMAWNRALAALVTLQERKLKKPASAGQYWSRAEDKQICEELHMGMNFEEIAKTHNRTVPSIIVRLVKLGQIAPNKIGFAVSTAGRMRETSASAWHYDRLGGALYSYSGT
jgi:hypothetical protein